MFVLVSVHLDFTFHFHLKPPHSRFDSRLMESDSAESQRQNLRLHNPEHFEVFASLFYSRQRQIEHDTRYGKPQLPREPVRLNLITFCHIMCVLVAQASLLPNDPSGLTRGPQTPLG
jgi:hypothetical protein